MAAPADAAPAPPRADTALGPAADRAQDPARRLVGWAGLGVAALSFLSGLFVATALGALYAGARGFDQSEATADLGFSLVTSAGLWVGFLVLPVLWSRRHGGPARLLGLSARWSDVPLGLAVGLGSAVATAVVSSALLSTGDREALEAKAEVVVDRAQGPVAVVLLVVALCLVTPLVEETFFRGLLFGSVNRLVAAVVAVAVAGLAFGPVHLDGGLDRVALVQIGLLGLFGVALCALASRTGRLGASIVAHATFNSVTVVTLLTQR